MNPRNSVNYCESVLQAIGRQRGGKSGKLKHASANRGADDFIRLFMAPGMAHCAVDRG